MQEESGKMTAQEYLGQVEQKIIAVKNMNSGINNLREVLVSIGGMDSGERVQTSRNNDKFGSIFARIDEKERIMDEKSKELIEFTAKVENEICSMENPQYMTLLHSGIRGRSERKKQRSWKNHWRSMVISDCSSLTSMIM